MDTDILPLPDDALPPPNVLERLLRAPTLDADGRIVGGLYHGMTPAEVLRDRERYRRIVGE